MGRDISIAAQVLGTMRRGQQLRAKQARDEEPESQQAFHAGVAHGSLLQNMAKAFSTYSRWKLRTMNTSRESCAG